MTYIYRALINALSTHVIHINLNMIHTRTHTRTHTYTYTFLTLFYLYSHKYDRVRNKCVNAVTLALKVKIE